MIEELLTFSKETDEKIRWSKYVESDATDFHLYIPKWRVPEPWPERIIVSIEPLGDELDHTFERNRVSSNTEPIEEIVERKEDHTKTVRYAPVGEPKSWHTGEPYIPFSLIPSGSRYVRLRVKWVLAS